MQKDGVEDKKGEEEAKVLGTELKDQNAIDVNGREKGELQVEQNDLN